MIHLHNVSSENVIHWKSLFVTKTIQENECDWLASECVA